MKFLILFAVVVAASIVAADVSQQEKKVDEHVKKCQKDFSVSNEELAELKEGKLTNAKENLRCFVNCFMEESGLLKDNVLQEEKILKEFALRVGDEKAKTILDTCKVEKGEAKCESALKYHNCFHKLGAY